MVAQPPLSDIDWQPSYRIIRSIYPPIDLFEDIADAADWELIASAEAKTNPRVRDQIGDLSLVPAERRVSGPGATYAMAPFTHVSRDRDSRFSDGSYGVWYGGNSFDVALMETVHHCERFMRATNEAAADVQYRELMTRVTGKLHDIRGAGFEDCLRPDDWAAGQALGKTLHQDGSDGIVYPSVRWPKGEAVALFWPNLIQPPINQARHLLYHWDGAHVTKWFVIGGSDWYTLPT